jgi:hypothetical protein
LFISLFFHYIAPRKYESGHQKLKKKKKKIEELIESQKGALEKFVTSNKQNITEKLGDSSTNENNSYDSQLKDTNENNLNDSQSKDTNENNLNDS